MRNSVILRGTCIFLRRFAKSLAYLVKNKISSPLAFKPKFLSVANCSRERS